MSSRRHFLTQITPSVVGLSSFSILQTYAASSPLYATDMKLKRDQGVGRWVQKRQRPSGAPSGRPCFWPGCPGVTFGLPNATATSSQTAPPSKSTTASTTTSTDGSALPAVQTSQSTSTNPIPTDLSSQTTIASSKSIPLTVVIAVVCSILGLILLLFVCLCVHRRRRMRQLPPEHEKIEAFDVEAEGTRTLAHPDLVINVSAPPNEHGVQPYPFLLPTSAATTTTLASSAPTGKSLKAKYGLRASSSTAASAASSSSSASSAYPSTMSSSEQQRMMSQLLALQEHIRQVEALARNGSGGGNQAAAQQQEPPPMYVATSNAETGGHVTRRREKM